MIRIKENRNNIDTNVKLGRLSKYKFKQKEFILNFIWMIYLIDQLQKYK